MPEIADIYLGNINDDCDLAKSTAIETCLKVHLTQSDRTKGRIHAYTDCGIAVGIVKSRDRLLQSGDIFQTQSRKLLLIHLQEQKLLVLDFSAIEANTYSTKLVQLGHLLGNHHYPIFIQGDRVMVQLVDNTTIIEKIIRDLQISGLKLSYEMGNIDSEIAHSTHRH